MMNGGASIPPECNNKQGLQLAKETRDCFLLDEILQIVLLDPAQELSFGNDG
jgi:hypothetical protein